MCRHICLYLFINTTLHGLICLLTLSREANIYGNVLILKRIKRPFLSAAPLASYTRERVDGASRRRRCALYHKNSVFYMRDKHLMKWAPIFKFVSFSRPRVTTFMLSSVMVHLPAFKSVLVYIHTQHTAYLMKECFHLCVNKKRSALVAFN